MDRNQYGFFKQRFHLLLIYSKLILLHSNKCQKFQNGINCFANLVPCPLDIICFKKMNLNLITDEIHDGMNLELYYQ